MQSKETYFRIAKPRASKYGQLKTTMDFLSAQRNPNLIKGVVRTAPDDVVKTLCNVALNAEQGDVKLTKGAKRLLRQNRKAVHALTSKKRSLVSKRKVLQRGGFLPLIPLLAGGILGTLGSQMLRPGH